MRVAIVILNYNGAEHLKRYLPSVIDNHPRWSEIIVADNASTDHSLNVMKTEFPSVKLIEMKANKGFAGGYNEALKDLNHEYYVLLNSDVAVTPGWLEKLIEPMDISESIVAAQPKIRDYKNKSRFEYAGAAGGFIDKYWFPFCRGRLFDNCERDIGQHNDPREVFWASGACLAIKSKAYWDVQGLDEDLFAHMEEIDLCWRLKNINYQIYCYPASLVFHLGGGTLAAVNPRKTYLNFRNNLLIAVKNDYRGNLFGRMFKRLAMDGIAACHFLISKGFGHFWAVIRAHFAFYMLLPKYLKKRQYWKDQNQSPNRTGMYNTSVVSNYFLDKKKVFSALTTRAFTRQNRSK